MAYTIESTHQRALLGVVSAFTSILIMVFLWTLVLASVAYPKSKNDGMTETRALKLAEEFGLDVGKVDEEIKEFLGLTKAEGVVVFEVIGGTAADRAGIKVKAIIKEVDGKEIGDLLELGRVLEIAMPTENFSVVTFEPASPDDQGVGGGLNFHLVRVNKD